MPSTYLVTGGAGFIGSHLVAALLARGDRVTVLDDLSTGRLGNLDRVMGDPAFRFVHGSVMDEITMDELAREHATVVHLAAAVGVKLIIDRGLRSFRSNIRGTEIVLDAVRRHGAKVLIASTSEIYGRNDADALREDSDRILGSPAVARWAYSTSKAVGEVLAHAYHKEMRVPVVIVRLFNTVGPGQSPAYGMVVPTFVRQALAGEPLTVYGTGEQRRCFCHVLDTVDALVRLLDSPGAVGETFNVGRSEEITILRLAQRVLAATGSDSRVVYLPYDEAYESGFEDMMRRVPDTSKLRSLTGWRPTRTLDDILRDAIASAAAERVPAGSSPLVAPAGPGLLRP